MTQHKSAYEILSEMKNVQRRRKRTEMVLGILDQRQEQYGSPLPLFTMLASRWSALLGVKITPETVAIMMMDLKSARYMKGSRSQDTVDDLMGYAILLGELSHGPEEG